MVVDLNLKIEDVDGRNPFLEYSRQTTSRELEVKVVWYAVRMNDLSTFKTSEVFNL